jgi:hypothetical protein
MAVPCVLAWGFSAHRKISNKAVATLPKAMQGFYVYYSDYITIHAVDPDKKRYCHMDEGAHHFIDLNHYGAYPSDSLPRHWKDAVARYTVDTLNKYGTLPWYISLQYYNLVEAFKDQDADMILKYSSDLSHYIADSYVPLHTTTNYDGQETGQNGIHAFWESNIPELFGNSYNYEVGQAKYIKNVNEFVWSGILSSATEVDSVLRVERNLKKIFPRDRMYCFEKSRMNQIVPRFSEDFTKAYSQKLNGMVERRMRSSILAVGSLWMSAWAEAGQPDLDKLIGKSSVADENVEE